MSAVGVDASVGADVSVGAETGVEVDESAVGSCVTAMVVGETVDCVSIVLICGGEEAMGEPQPANKKTAMNGIVIRFMFTFTYHLD